VVFEMSYFTEGEKRWIKNHTKKSLQELYGKTKGVNMKPTKVAAKRVVKKKPAKKAYRKDSIVGKLLQLKYRMNDMMRNGGPGVDMDELRADKGYVMNLIDGVRQFGWTKLSREDGLKCNSLWGYYEGK
jgi:hypothetical protein